MASHFQAVFLLCFTGGLLFEGAMSTSRKVIVPVPGCPPGWAVFGSRCFIYRGDVKDMVNAEFTCIRLGGNLASIHSAEEHKFVRDLTRRKTGHHPDTWIGGHDSLLWSKWMWTDGSKFDYKDWNKGQPDNYKQSEHCLQINAHGWGWNDLSCSFKRPFICAKPLTVSVNIRTD